MSVTYILAGGLDRAHQEYWDNLGRELKLNRPVKILSCFFSQPKNDWEEKFEGFKPFFARAFGADVECELANPDKFIEQIKRSDVIYLHGGSSHRLKAVLKRYDGLQSYFSNKIVIGSSAGANYLSKVGWSPNLREVIRGSGMVPISVLVHYGSTFADDEVLGPISWEEALRQLEEITPDNSKIALLKEGEFIIYNDEDN